MSRSAGPAVDLFGALAGLGEPAGGVPAKTLDALAVCRPSLWPLSVPWWLAVVEAVRGCALAWDARRERSDGRTWGFTGCTRAFAEARRRLVAEFIPPSYLPCKVAR